MYSIKAKGGRRIAALVAPFVIHAMMHVLGRKCTEIHSLLWLNICHLLAFLFSPISYTIYASPTMVFSLLLDWQDAAEKNSTFWFVSLFSTFPIPLPSLFRGRKSYTFSGQKIVPLAHLFMPNCPIRLARATVVWVMSAQLKMSQHFRSDDKPHY